MSVANEHAKQTLASLLDEFITEPVSAFGKAVAEVQAAPVEAEPVEAQPAQVKRLNRGYRRSKEAGESAFQHAFVSFVEAVTFQCRPPVPEEDHAPDMILPETYGTLITAARTLLEQIPTVEDIRDLSRLRGKALQLTYARRALAEDRRAFIIRYSKREEQKALRDALAQAMRDIANLCDERIGQLVAKG